MGGRIYLNRTKRGGGGSVNRQEKKASCICYLGGGENDWVAGFTSKMLCVFIRVYIHEQEQVGGWVGGWSFSSLLLLGACVSVRRHGTG